MKKQDFTLKTLIEVGELKQIDKTATIKPPERKKNQKN